MRAYLDFQGLVAQAVLHEDNLELGCLLVNLCALGELIHRLRDTGGAALMSGFRILGTESQQWSLL